MNEENNEKIRQALRRAILPVMDRELKRDLWPQMLRRLEERPAQIPWFDWAVTAAPLVWFVFFPEQILVLLYLL